MPDIQLVLDMAASPPGPAAKPCGSAKKRRRGAAGAPAWPLTLLVARCDYVMGRVTELHTHCSRMDI